MENKKQILEKIFGATIFNNQTDFLKDCIYDAMDEYAAPKQQEMAIGFASWCMQNVSEDNDGYYDVQLNIPVVGGKSYRSMKMQSMKDLYTLYLQSLNK